MRVLDNLLNATAVYWPPGPIDKWGRHSPESPKTLRCAVQKQKIVNSTPEGKTFVEQTTVHLAEPVEKEGWLYVGNPLRSPELPGEQDRIKSVSEHHDVDNRERLWVASL